MTMEKITTDLSSRNLYFIFDYAHLRGWRVVNMADSDGVVREGIFIPFFQNGMMLSDKRDQIVQALYQTKAGVSGKKLGFIEYAPMINKELHTKLVDAGIIEKDITPWSQACMGVKVNGWRLSQRKKG